MCGCAPALAMSCTGSGGSTGWALRTRPWLRLRMGDAEGAVQGYLRAVRLDPSSAPLWEGLGAAYQTLGRHTAALKV
jgi:superkiller protein 3